MFEKYSKVQWSVVQSGGSTLCKQTAAARCTLPFIHQPPSTEDGWGERRPRTLSRAQNRRLIPTDVSIILRSSSSAVAGPRSIHHVLQIRARHLQADRGWHRRSRRSRRVCCRWCARRAAWEEWPHPRHEREAPRQRGDWHRHHRRKAERRHQGLSRCTFVLSTTYLPRRCAAHASAHSRKECTADTTTHRPTSSSSRRTHCEPRC